MKTKLIYGLCFCSLLPLFRLSAQSSSDATEEEAVELPPFNVTASETMGYGTPNALGATRVNVAITDTPNSVVILNRELMDDLGTTDGLDILKYASGVNPASTRTINVVSMRGEEVRPGNGANFLDGLPGGATAEIETEFIERIEIVKGPAGTLYGSHSLGGIINRVSKRPLDIQQTVLKTVFDTDLMIQGSFDTTGPLGESGFAYRSVGVIRDGETPAGAPDNKEAIYFVGSFEPENIPGRVWGRYSYQHIESGHEAFNWFYDGAGEPSKFLGADFLSTPGIPLAERWNHSLEAGFETRVDAPGSTWNMRIVGRYDQQISKEDAIIPLGYDFYDAEGNLIGSTGAAVDASQPTFAGTDWVDIRLGNHSFRRAGSIYGRPNRQYGAYLDVVGDFETGFIRHRLLTYTQLSGAKSHGGLITYSLPEGYEFSVINPEYVDIDSLKTNPTVASHTEGSSNAFNFGIQDNLFMFDDRLILVGGARYDYSIDHGSLNKLTGVRSDSRSVNNWVYKGGIVVKPFSGYQGISFFYSYSETFTPQSGTTRAGVQFKDIEGVAHEIGVKLELEDYGIIATASIFDNENTNFPIRILDPETGLDDFVQNGTGESKGWEADIAWQPRPNLSFLFAISDVDSTNPNGLYKRNVQNDINYRAVGRYEFIDGVLENFAVGAGFVNIADRAGDNPNSFITRGYNTLDLFFTYSYEEWKAQLNIFNVLDENGVESSIVSSIAMAQRPIGARFTLEYTF